MHIEKATDIDLFMQSFQVHGTAMLPSGCSDISGRSKCKGFAHYDVAIVWRKKHMFLGFQSGATMEHSRFDIYLKTLMVNYICGPTFLIFRDEEWAAGIETGDSPFQIGPAKELCLNNDGQEIEEALHLFGTIRQIESDGTANLCIQV